MYKVIIVTYINSILDNSKIISLIKINIQIALIFFILFLYGQNDLIAQNKGNADLPGEYTVGDTRLLSLPNYDEPTKVYASFHLQDIDEINDQLETFHLVGSLNLKWNDPRQKFDPKDLGVTEKVYQGNYQFNELAPSWFPQIEIVNIAGDLDIQAILLRVKPDGTCILTQSINVLVKSRLRLSRYPFDSQQLKVIFNVMGYNSEEVVLVADSNSITSNYNSIRIPQWQLTGLSADVQNYKTPYLNNDDISSCVVFKFDVERESFFVIRLIVLPLTLIVILSWSVFWMAQSSLGDRMSVSFVGILTAVTYQVLVSGILPQISYFTLMHSFLGINFLIMCLTIVINLIVGFYDRKGDQETGDKIDRICKWAFPIGFASLSFIQWQFFY